MDKIYMIAGSPKTWQLDTDYSDMYSTLEKATDAARSKAWKEGKDVLILETIATVTKPELVNTCKVVEA